MDYKTAGVDIEAGYKSVELMKEHVKRTMREEVLGGLGGFSGAFSLAKIKEMEEPVLLSGTDGCGTKVKLAMVMDKHDTIGINQQVIAHNIECHKYHCLFTVKAAYQRNPHKSQVGEYHHQAVAVDLGGGKPHDPGKYLAEQYQHHKKDSHQDKILRNHGRTVCNCFVQDT